MEKKILDVCCGGRMMWFTKDHPNAIYIDIREQQVFETGKGVDNRKKSILPDHVMDFRNLKFDNESFSLVVMDPPHLMIGKKSYYAQIYGSLDENWREDLKLGISESFRVLKENGIFIFKWNESDIKVSEILKLTTHKPLFGHRSGKAQKTHWLCFMKIL